LASHDPPALIGSNRLNHSFKWAEESERVFWLARLLQVGDPIGGDIPKTEPAASGLDHSFSTGDGSLRIGFRSFITNAQQVDELALGRQQIGAIDRDQRLVFFDNVATRGDVQFLDVSIDSADEIPMALLVVSDDANGANSAMKRLLLNGGISDANLL